MQLSIQAYAQKQAKELVQAWGERANVQVGDVRYHLLRNGLILKNIQIRRQKDTVSISQMFLRANPKLLTGNAPRIGVIDIFGLDAEMAHIGQASVWQQDRYLKQIWQAATSLTVHDGNMKLYVHDKDRPPLVLSGLFLRQRLQFSTRSITGSARMQQGLLHWQWDIFATPEAAPPEMTKPQTLEHWLSKGTVQWQALDAKKLTAALALKPMAGHLSGELSWEINRHKQQQLFNMHGDMQFDAGVDNKSSHAHRLQYSATETGGDWQMDIDAAAWPLDPWSDVLPRVGARQFISAQLDGTMHWQGQPGNWHIRSDKGLLQDVTYARADSSASPAWYWSRIHYNQARIQTAKHQLQLAELDMLDSRLVLQTKRMDANQTDDNLRGNATTEKVAVNQDTASEIKAALKEPVWAISADKINVQNMMLALNMPQGRVILERLDGQAHSPQGKALNFKLHTHEEPATDTGTAPAGKESKEQPPQWQLRGKAEKNRQGQLTSASIKIRGSHIPVARLRPLLPLQDDADRPVKLAGETDLNATVTVDRGEWQMQGKATVRGLNLAHGGDVFLADQLDLQFGPVGMGLETQTIDKIDTQGWQYIAALRPLPLHEAEQSEHDAGSPGGAAWWATALRNNHIAITRLNLENGQISVGQQQAIWAEKVNIQADNVQIDRWSDITMSGDTGGSKFYLQGQWQALSNPQRFRGDAGLEKATPFFLHNWMVASGMPRLIQGRLSASLHLEDGQVLDSYQGAVKLQLLQGLTETGVFTSDPMLPRTGYSTPELLQRLEQRAGVIALQYDLDGLWPTQAITLERLGFSMQRAMHEAARTGNWREENATEQSTIEARIRLHGRERLSLNERTRLSKVIHKLRQHPELIIDLKPKWTGRELTKQEQQRILRTQLLIEKYMTHRKIDKNRIFPIWPTATDQVDEIGSVQVETRRAG